MKGLSTSLVNIRVLVPDVIEHYSIRAAMSWLGMGESHVIRVPVDSDYRVSLPHLERIIDEERWKGHHILAFVCYAGDSRSMRIDHLDSVSKLLQMKQIWMHVDACHCSQLAFSRKHRHKLAGIENADSITIDPHKVLWIPNTCSYVLFKDPKRLSNISTNSDLILKTQWSLGQITPCIGSKAFDSLKLWSTIKYFGQGNIEKFIDERLDLTEQIQNAIEEEPDLVLLNRTDINSCMLIFVPATSQAVLRQYNIKFSASDCEKLRKINHAIYEFIRRKGKWYLHGFNLKRCPHPIFEEDTAMYALRTMNGNPSTTIRDVRGLLSQIVEKGNDLLQESEYRVLTKPFTGFAGLSVGEKLSGFFNRFLQGYEFEAIVYGSGACSNLMIFSDVDLMVVVEDGFDITDERRSQLESGFRKIMRSEGVQIDAEVPFHRKLLVPVQFVKSAATGSYLRIVDGDVAPIEKTPDYLTSDEMLGRLTFNVLTVPSRHLCGTVGMLTQARVTAALSLFHLIDKVRATRHTLSARQFAQRAIVNEQGRSGEEYLGYKSRPEVVERLEKMWQIAKDSGALTTYTMSPLSLPKGCVVLLNGFPGIGKLSIAQALRSKLRDTETRLFDNHLVIDPAQAVYPGRGPEHKLLRSQLRKVAFSNLASLHGKNIILIMTACLAANEEDAAVFADHVEIARSRGVPIHVFTVTCNMKEHHFRLQSPDRIWGQKRKLSEPGEFMHFSPIALDRRVF